MNHNKQIDTSDTETSDESLGNLSESSENEVIESALFENSSEIWELEPMNGNYDPKKLDVFEENTKYKDYFYEEESYNVAVQSKKKENFVFSITMSPNDEDSIYVLCHSKEKSVMKEISTTGFKISLLRKMFCKGYSIKEILKNFDKSLTGSKHAVCLNVKEDNEILIMEKTGNVTQFKIGVLYVGEGQTKETEFLSNQEGSSAWNEFLEILGDKVTLMGWEGFSGGLNTKRDRSGKESIFTKWNDYEIMYHVSTLLKHSEKDPQQIVKKKHIGNDVVVIIFIDGDQKYDPESLKSKQNHILIAVKPIIINEETKYRVEVLTKTNVPKYEPRLPNPPIFNQDQIRDFILTKVCQGERVAQKTGQFIERYLRFREAVLKKIVNRYIK
ncbi:rap gtpase-activating protein [Anaeramoeba flamelloides]|uniref:Rap gtpase-activating protein n=1 Tax=Anaeramoeba flamelloides TaxID=1746091 RepID=A0AAV7Y7Y2_9EUKA|nr:rap gtpase-activating protein [Anaeramoeba flamelloides]KAJ6234688.1 rap gtpase-activating protein [Anaeramoeba flamelloides]